jgi:hypothetical protein
MSHETSAPITKRAGAKSPTGGQDRWCSYRSTSNDSVSQLAFEPALRDRKCQVFYAPGMSLEWEQLVVDAHDPESLGRWWRDALGWVVVNEDPEEFEIRPTAERFPGLLFVSISETKLNKNRLHLDFRPDNRDAEVERLLALGARHADVGQGEQSWVVLADPEGNEFCVLGSRSPAS